jgi:hypothetical protein
MVLGSQRLTVLRDAISCPADVNLSSERLQLSRPSAFFYIEGVFYNDRRDPSSLVCKAAGLDAPPPAPPVPHAEPPVESACAGALVFMCVKRGLLCSVCVCVCVCVCCVCTCVCASARACRFFVHAHVCVCSTSLAMFTSASQCDFKRCFHRNPPFSAHM